MQPVPLTSIVAEIRPLDARHLSFEPVDSMVADAIFWFGVQGYEGRVANVWTTLCRNAGSVLEICGNIGLFTVIGADAASGRYAVLEPVPSIAAILAANLRRNGLAARVEVIQAAAVPDPSECRVVLNLPEEGRAAPVGAHLLDVGEVAGRGTQQHLTVRGVPFRDLVAEADVVKIDAEGVEADLIESARDVILARRPAMLIEVLPESRRLGRLLAALAREAGYHIQIVPEYGSDALVEVSPDMFTSELPKRHNSKDVLLTRAPLS